MYEDVYHLGIKGLIRNAEGKVLLLKVNPAELKGNRHGEYWDLPGGRVHRGSTVEETLKREIEEETGITEVVSCTPLAMVLSKLRIPVGESDVGLILGVYVCDAIVKDIRLSKEHVAAEWFKPQEAAELLKVKYPSELTDKIKML